VDRRTFVAGAVSVLAAPLAAEAQQAGKVRPYRVGVLHPAFGETTPGVLGLKGGLKAAALEEGRDVVFEIRFTRGEVHALPAAARALSLAGVDLIFSVGEAATRAAMVATSTVPIVLVGVGDPVAAGVVKAVAHPGGNVTGVSGLETELAPKRVEILKALVPTVRRVWAVHHVDDPSATAATRAAQEAASHLGVEVVARSVRTAEELANTLKGIPHGDGLLAPYDTILDIPGQMFVASLWARLPVIYPVTFWARGGAAPDAPASSLGGLAAYGSDYEAEGLQAARLVAKVLRGATPRDLPVEGAQVRLVINLKTAKALSLTIPPAALARADEIIQ
jgi:putative tryptophan/tyrosine transport system substrate-binding protein